MSAGVQGVPTAATVSPAAARPAAPQSLPPPIVRHLGLVEYEPTWRAMQRFTAQRDAGTADEIWFLEHPPVFTLGVSASRAHLLSPGDIPVVQIDRGAHAPRCSRASGPRRRPPVRRGATRR